MGQPKWLMDLAPVSSLQCVDALWRLGFKIDEVNDARVRLVRADGRRVAVPRHKTIEAIELRVILMTAGVEEAAFIDVLHRRSKSGELPEPDVASSGIRPQRSPDVPDPSEWPAKGRAG